MATQGPLNAGTAANDSSFGTVAWSNLTNITASDNSRVGASATGYTQYLKVTNFGFSIPSGATINGVTVSVERRSAAGVSMAKDARVRIVKGGTIGSTDKASSSAWPYTTDGTATYGSSSDLWGETLTDTDINNSTFGMAIAATKFGGKAPSFGPEIDTVTITIDYTAAGGGSTPGNSTQFLQLLGLGT